MPTEYRFYHLQRQTLDQALPQIAAKAYERGHRLVIRTNDTKTAEHLNAVLWTYNEQSFLPHGTKKDGHEIDQPIWITDKDENPNNADVLMTTDGKDVPPETIETYTLCCDIFDGALDDQLQAARGRWKALKDAANAAITMTYWQQNDQGGWEKKA